METKQLIRKRILEIRDRLKEDERMQKSGLIAERVLADSHYRDSKVILLYLDFSGEVLTAAIAKDAFREGKKVFCPKVFGNEMDFYEIGSLKETSPGRFGIREPDGSSECFGRERYCSCRNQIYMVMPGVAFDQNRNRVGYGRGYYDRFLSRYPDLYKAALCFSCQLTDAVPAEENDIRPDILYTEEGIY